MSAIAMRPAIQQLLAQTLEEKPTFSENRKKLLDVALKVTQGAEKLARQAKGRVTQSAGRS